MDRLWTPWRYAYVTGADRGQSKPGVPEALAAWPGDLHCVFCNIIAAADYAVANRMPRDDAEAAAGILERGASCYMVLNGFPYNSGHLTVVPETWVSSDALVGFGWAASSDSLVAELSFTTKVQLASWRPGERRLAIAVLTPKHNPASLVIGQYEP